MDTLVKTVEGFGCPRMILVGDFMLDEYVYGDVGRISPEAPVPVLTIDAREHRCGGGGNVAAMMASLGGTPECVGIVGCDAHGDTLVDRLGAVGAGTAGLLAIDDRPTVVKTRFVGRAQHKNPHQILRADEEDTAPVPPALRGQLLSSVSDLLDAGDTGMLVVQDHGKGLLGGGFAREVLDLARRAECITVVDPSPIQDYSVYRGAAVITPNRFEASLASGCEITDETSAAQAATILMDTVGADAVIITLDREGAYLMEKSGRRLSMPTEPRNVYDGTGAGDAVVAVFSFAVANGCDFQTALALANIAGGLEVERFGVVPVTREEIVDELRFRTQGTSKLVSDTTLLSLVERQRREGRKIVFTNGCFDLLHAGHVAYLKDARNEGDCLIVAINSDDSVRRLKGPGRPVVAQDYRASVLSALECVDYVVVFDDDTPLRLLDMLRPDVLVKGGSTSAIVGKEEVEAYGGAVKHLALIEGLSTSAIIDKILEENDG